MGQSSFGPASKKSSCWVGFLLRKASPVEWPRWLLQWLLVESVYMCVGWVGVYAAGAVPRAWGRKKLRANLAYLAVEGVPRYFCPGVGSGEGLGPYIHGFLFSYRHTLLFYPASSSPDTRRTYTSQADAVSGSRLLGALGTLDGQDILNHILLNSSLRPSISRESLSPCIGERQGCTLSLLARELVRGKAGAGG